MPRPEDRVLDYRPGGQPAASRAYGIRKRIERRVDRKVKLWRAAQRRTDQFREGACVGHGWINELMALPTSVYITDPNAYALQAYREMQFLDIWADTPPAEGTSVHAGWELMRNRGFITEAYWAEDTDEVIDSLCSIDGGPVVVGTKWYDSMYETRPSGLVEIGGSVVGGHCYLLTGYHPKLHLPHESGPVEAIRFRNSWGIGYGYRGDAWITVEDFDARLAPGAELCVPVKRVRTP